MNDWMGLLINGDLSATLGGPQTALLCMLLSFCLGHVVGWIYMWSHTGLSYSRMFVSSLVVIPVIVSLLMLLMSGNIVIAFGLLAVFAIVRFRNVLKDTRDTSFILWTIVTGMAVGTLRFSTAIIGCAFIAFVFMYLRFTGFGTRHRYDVVLSLQLTGDLVDGLGKLKLVLRRHCAHVQLANERSLSDEGLDLSYRLLLRDPGRSQELLWELRDSLGITNASLYKREDESEF